MQNAVKTCSVGFDSLPPLELDNVTIVSSVCPGLFLLLGFAVLIHAYLYAPVR